MAFTPQNNPLGNSSYNFEGSNIGAINSTYVFSALQKPDISDYITYRFPQYSITTLLGRIGRKDPVVGNDQWQWFEKGLFRKPYTIGAGSSGLTGGTTATVKILSATTVNVNLLPNDVVRFENNQFGVITALVNNSSDVDATILSLDGNNFALQSGDAFSHMYNLQKEYSDSGNGRVWQEETITEKMAIMRRNIICTTTQASNIKWVKKDGKPYYYYINEWETMQEFAMDREMYVLTGKQSSTDLSTSNYQGGNGILPRVLSEGVYGTFSTAVGETDLQEQIRLMTINSEGTEFTVLCGSKFLRDAQRALKDYYVGGSVKYGEFSGKPMVGINVQQYTFMGKIINFVHYMPFDNPSLFPTPVRTGIDWSNGSLWLNMGNDPQGNPLIQLKYKKDMLGNSLEFSRTIQEGISSPEAGAGVRRANGKDGFTVDLYTSIGVELRAPNNHGVLVAA